MGAQAHFKRVSRGAAGGPFLGRLDGAIATLGESSGVLAMLRRMEAVASSRLDGVQASLLNLLDAEGGLGRPGPPGMWQNYGHSPR